MDATPAIVAGAFLCGWIGRDWTIGKPETPTCKCECNWKGSSTVVADPAGTSSLVWALGLAVILLALVAFSNTALALRVSYQDSQTGANREWQVGVKGKSKGVLGSVKGLAITG